MTLMRSAGEVMREKDVARSQSDIQHAILPLVLPLALDDHEEVRVRSWLQSHGTTACCPERQDGLKSAKARRHGRLTWEVQLCAIAFRPYRSHVGQPLHAFQLHACQLHACQQPIELLVLTSKLLPSVQLANMPPLFLWLHTGVTASDYLLPAARSTAPSANGSSRGTCRHPPPRVEGR